MSALYPFRALRPTPDAASLVAPVPYDVVNADEARALVAGNPLSFLRVTRAEVDLPPETNPYDSRVYAQAVGNLEELKREAPLLIEDEPSLYFYRLRMGSHEQVGLAGCFSLDEYDRDVIKKHERTRKDKEDDRTRHLIDLRAQTGIVFLTYRASSEVDAIAKRTLAGSALYDFVGPDGVAHAIWQVTGKDLHPLVDAFAKLPALYIADGHHRAASAARARETVKTAEAQKFIAVAFPDSQAQILPYNRVVKDFGGRTPEAFLAAVQSASNIRPGKATPDRQGEVGMFLNGKWYTLELPPGRAASRADELDVARLEREILGPLLKIGDIRTDKRIDFVGGARGTAELERLVTKGQAAVAFSMYPVTIKDLMEISDAGGIMPPKSTWFEPKLRDGLLVHLI